MPVSPQRIVVGISGATGFADGVCALRLLRKLGLETHLVVSRAGDLTREYESDMSREQLRALADVVHPIADVGSLISSGSFKTIGMLVAPCSIRTLSGIAVGTTDNLLTRAADVVLKERRRLALMVRETPLHAGHLKSMLAVTEMGRHHFPAGTRFLYQSPLSGRHRAAKRRSRLGAVPT
jgi:4-hydroxy-3-polyprenylbenzoate decarboxylase